MEVKTREKFVVWRERGFMNSMATLVEHMEGFLLA
jgi:hypothetical protein